MILYITNKLASLRGSSTVVDEDKNPIYKVKGKFFSITHKKRICTLDNKVLYSVRNKFFNWWSHSAFIYDENKEKIARVKKKVDLKGTFFVEGYKDEIKIEGNFFKLTSTIYRNGEQIGTIKREIKFFVDSFVLDANEEDMPFLIALVIAIDNIYDKVSKV